MVTHGERGVESTGFGGSGGGPTCRRPALDDEIAHQVNTSRLGRRVGLTPQARPRVEVAENVKLAEI
jgi:hypothetical protein